MNTNIKNETQIHAFYKVKKCQDKKAYMKEYAKKWNEEHSERISQRKRTATLLKNGALNEVDLDEHGIYAGSVHKILEMYMALPTDMQNKILARITV